MVPPGCTHTLRQWVSIGLWTLLCNGSARSVLIARFMEQFRQTTREWISTGSGYRLAATGGSLRASANLLVSVSVIVILTPKLYHAR